MIRIPCLEILPALDLEAFPPFRAKRLSFSNIMADVSIQYGCSFVPSPVFHKNDWFDGQHLVAWGLLKLMRHIEHQFWLFQLNTMKRSKKLVKFHTRGPITNQQKKSMKEVFCQICGAVKVSYLNGYCGFIRFQHDASAVRLLESQRSLNGIFITPSLTVDVMPYC